VAEIRAGRSIAVEERELEFSDVTRVGSSF
jgi:hypothetical protein